MMWIIGVMVVWLVAMLLLWGFVYAATRKGAGP
jgi:hypothetical protein